MSYKECDKCVTCGREVVLQECDSCGGSGKSFGSWKDATDICPRCSGKGYWYHCPISWLLPILSGKTCRSIPRSQDEKYVQV